MEPETKRAPLPLLKLDPPIEMLQDPLTDEKPNSFVVLKLTFRDNRVSASVVALALIEDLRAFKSLKHLVQLIKVLMPHSSRVLLDLKVQTSLPNAVPRSYIEFVLLSCHRIVDGILDQC